MFGTPVLATPKPVDRGGRRGAQHDCGKHGQLTVGQIAKVSGISVDAVRFRVNAGWKGEALCAPYRSQDKRKRDSGCRNPAVLTAVRLALAFPNRAPTTKEIMAIRPMSRGCASRWRQAFRDVLERDA